MIHILSISEFKLFEKEINSSRISTLSHICMFVFHNISTKVVSVTIMWFLIDKSVCEVSVYLQEEGANQPLEKIETR